MSVDSVSQWKLEVEQGCAIITLHMSFFHFGAASCCFSSISDYCNLKKSPPPSSATDSSVRVGVHMRDRAAVGPFISV